MVGTGYSEDSASFSMGMKTFLDTKLLNIDGNEMKNSERE
jgi:hypothetical protein